MKYSKARLLFILSVWLLLVVVIVSIFTPVRDIVLNRLFPPAGTPTASIAPGGNLFYIQSSPPGQIYIDGKLVAHLPNLNKQPPDAPLNLSRGKHQIVWEATPFKPVVCALSVPPQMFTEACNDETIIQDSAGQNVRLITFTASFTDLPVTQQSLLEQRIQNALNTLQSTETVQTGEQYLATSATGGASARTATQALKATLSFHMDTSLTSNRNCVDGYGDTCTYNGQNCLELCVFTNVQAINGSTFTPLTGPDWYAIALFYPTWTYRMANGVPVAENQPDVFSQSVGTDHSMLVHILWKAGAWSVSLEPNANLANIPITVDPACASLNGLIHATTTYIISHDGIGTNLDWQEFAGTDRAAGCLGVATPHQFQAPTAYVLYRFGVLLAANAAAHRYFPGLPVADSSEQILVQQIATTNGV